MYQKTLTKNGYEEIEVVDANGSKRKTNKPVHRIEDWREVKQEEFNEAHRYSQRILEDLYDDRATVEGVLKSKGRRYRSVVKLGRLASAKALTMSELSRVSSRRDRPRRGTERNGVFQLGAFNLRLRNHLIPVKLAVRR